MARSALLLALAASAICTSAAFASLYVWNDAKRPPISLSDALARAEKLLGDDAANRYCVDATLYGDESGEGKDGAWNLLYAAADGSKKIVYIPMQDSGEVDLWNGPIEWEKNEGRRTDMDDVRNRLETLFAKEGIEAEISINDGSLIAKYHTREYQIYPESDNGGYGEQLRQVTGPMADGIWLQVRVVEQPDRRGYDYRGGPYWRWARGTYFLTHAGKFLAVDLRYGKGIRNEVARQMRQIFGEETPDD